MDQLTKVLRNRRLFMLFSLIEKEATLAFFEVAAPFESQDATGLKKAIINTFKGKSLEPVVGKIVFLLSDGPLVNCRKHFGLIKLFQEDYLWVSFAKCFSHRHELALKDAVKEVLEPVDTSLCDFNPHLHAKFSMKHRKLKNLFNVLSGQLEMYSADVLPVKATGTRWIDHKTHAMDRVLKNLGYIPNICKMSNVISTTTNSKVRATLEEKYVKLVDANVFLHCVLFIDVLAEAKNFSLKTQNSY